MQNYDYDAPRLRAGTGMVKLGALLKTGGFYLCSFFLICWAISLYSYLGRIVAYLVIASIAASLTAWYLAPAGRDACMVALKRNLFIYSITLVGLYFVVSKLNGIDANTLGVSLGLSTGQTMNNAGLGWLQMMLQFIIIGTPITHIGNELKRIWTYRDNLYFGNKTAAGRSKQLQGTIVKR